MTRVTGIGGFFFRARDPRALAAWYETHLGVNDIAASAWRQEAGTTVFAPFAHDTDYFGRPEQVWMINFRVDDLDAMMATLKPASPSKRARSGIPRSAASAVFTIRRAIRSNCGSRPVRPPDPAGSGAGVVPANGPGRSICADPAPALFQGSRACPREFRANGRRKTDLRYASLATRPLPVRRFGDWNFGRGLFL